MSSRPRYPAGTGRPVAGRRGLRRDRRAIIAAAIPVAAVTILALILSLGDGGAASEAAGPLATPVPPPSESGSGAKPPEVVIARGEGVEVHLPVDSQRVTAAMFHPVNDTAGVALDGDRIAGDPPGRPRRPRGPRDGGPRRRGAGGHDGLLAG